MYVTIATISIESMCVCIHHINDINAADKVSYVTVIHELVSLKYDILMWYLKFIPTCLIPITRLSITDNTITIISVILIIKQNFLFCYIVWKSTSPLCSRGWSCWCPEVINWNGTSWHKCYRQCKLCYSYLWIRPFEV